MTTSVLAFLARAASRPFSLEMQLCIAFLAGVTIPIMVIVAGRA
jgi:hypothetical protein